MDKIAIIGAGNLGTAILEGLLKSNIIIPQNLFITRRNQEQLDKFEQLNVHYSTNNIEAVNFANIIILALQPNHIPKVLKEIKNTLTENHVLVSVASGVSLEELSNLIDNKKVKNIIRAMPNTAIAIQESMTCICSTGKDSLDEVKKIFNQLGEVMVIPEELMAPATALCACGTAFFLRAIRAASQGGIEIGFHSEDAIKMAAQTAKGAAELLLKKGGHPENHIDKVTTPKGITIAGLNEMEHNGFSSALIKGITTSAEKANKIYNKGNE